MFINFLFALGFIAIASLLLISLDLSTPLVMKFVKTLLKWSHRSKLLTRLILQAYVQYRKTLDKPLIPNPHQS